MLLKEFMENEMVEGVRSKGPGSKGLGLLRCVMEM